MSGAQSESICIAEMHSADLDAVLAIEAASYPHPWSREHFLHELASPHSFPVVLADNGTVVGYLCLMVLFEEAQVLNVAVVPEQRGRGAGRQLMEYAVSEARLRGAEFLSLEVRASNSAAIALYENFGFTRTGIRPRYYEGKEDAILMEKPLQGEL